MARDQEGHTGVILMAFIMGAITGAAVALLATPTSGSESRQVLNEKVEDGKKKVTVVTQQGREFVRRQRTNLSTAIDRGREAYQKARVSEEPVTED